MVKFLIGAYNPTLEQVWRNFATDERRQGVTTDDWLDIALEPFNGFDIPDTDNYIGFHTEEDLLAFILKFS